MPNKKHITDLHKDITEWKSQVSLVKDNLKIFNSHLAEVAGDNTATEILIKVEHYQNLFIRQDQASNDLWHDLKFADIALAEKAKGNDSADHILLEDHTELRDKVTTYIKIFREDKNSYEEFLAEVF